MTIHHGTHKAQLFRTGPKFKYKVINGYYLVLPCGDRYWLGLEVYTAAMALDKACDKYLSAKSGWQYWVDYCMGYDVEGNLAWANIDQTDILLGFLAI